jgi:hypothetical protein
LKKTRWCVLKRRATLTEHQRFRLRDLLRYNLQTARAYLLKEDFQQFWDYNTRCLDDRLFSSGEDPAFSIGCAAAEEPVFRASGLPTRSQEEKAEQGGNPAEHVRCTLGSYLP